MAAVVAYEHLHNVKVTHRLCGTALYFKARRGLPPPLSRYSRVTFVLKTAAMTCAGRRPARGATAIPT